MKRNRSVIAVLSDLHSGHRLGLANPNVKLQIEGPSGEYTEGFPELTEVQRYLWEIYTTLCIPEAEKLAGSDDLIVLCLGDITHGKVHPDELLVTRESDQLLIAESNLQPWLKRKKTTKIRIAKGTSSHSFGEGSSELIVEKMLRNSFPEKDIKTIYHGLAKIEDTWIDYAHHGPYSGSRNWLKGNEARYYLRSAMMDEIMSGEIPPGLYLRGHYHTVVIEYLRMKYMEKVIESWIAICPSLCLLGDYGRMATKSSNKITNGILCFEVVNGHIYTPIELTATVDIRTKEEL